MKKLSKLIKKFALFLLRFSQQYKDDDNIDSLLQKSKEKDCVELGHIWASKFTPNGEIKPTRFNTYCKRCGQMYHVHKYYHESKN